MSVPRRSTERDGDEPVERLWQLYADEIGIPGAGPTSSTPAPRESPRRAARSGTSLIVVAAMIGAALAGGIARLAYLGSAKRAPATAAQPPARDVATDGVAPRIEVGDHGDAALASAAAPVPSAVIEPPRPAPPIEAAGTAFTPASSGLPQPELAKPRERAGEGLPPWPPIAFEFGSDEIEGRSKPTLDSIAAAMKADPQWRLRIEGHTDAHGTPEYNRALSERRAQAVKSYLQRAGVDAARLAAIAFGASSPVAPNTGPGSALNRRVEFRRQ